eukprot:6579209-Pyramimonas_sp.AAC.1
MHYLGSLTAHKVRLTARWDQGTIEELKSFVVYGVVLQTVPQGFPKRNSDQSRHMPLTERPAAVPSVYWNVETDSPVHKSVLKDFLSRCCVRCFAGLTSGQFDQKFGYTATGLKLGRDCWGRRIRLYNCSLSQPLVCFGIVTPLVRSDARHQTRWLIEQYNTSSHNVSDTIEAPTCCTAGAFAASNAASSRLPSNGLHPSDQRNPTMREPVDA